jgi:uncharacterized protein (DUF1697 family)
MQTYISILRGINVGGQKQIQMADLKALYVELKFKDVITYIQSGNVIFKTDAKAANQSLADKIEKAILIKYQFDVRVLIRTIEELKKIITNNPFLNEKKIDIDKLHITFLSDKPVTEMIESINKLDYSPDKFIIAGKEVYLYCPNGYGRTKLSNNFFENKLNVFATTRNWKTVNKLAELALYTS